MDYFPLGEFTVNNYILTTTGLTLFFINKGYYPQSSIESPEPINKKLLYGKRLKMLLADQHANYIKNLLNYCKGEMAWAQAKQAYFADHHRTPPPKMHIGDWVWLNARNISTQRPMKSLNHKNLGPYLIKQIINKGAAYKLELPPTLATRQI